MIPSRIRIISLSICLVLLIGTMSLLTGCGNDLKSKLVSKVWECNDSNSYQKIEFYQDGTLSYHVKWSNDFEDQSTGVWSINNNELNVTSDFCGTIHVKFTELKESDIEKGLANINNNIWYVSDKYLVLHGDIYKS